MQLNKVSVDDINVKGKKVLVRCDFNVPLKDGVITNDNRITAALPTIKKLIADGGKVILCSHLGKPKNGPEEKFSLAPVAVRLSELLGQDVVFANDDEVVGENAKKAVAEMKDGDVVLLQNTRFRKEETKNLEPFSSELASLADVFVMDAFGSAHRAHCSTVGVTDHIKDTAVGYLMQKEIDYLGNAVETPVRPFVAILGGAKVADKLNVISNLLEKCDTLIIGGGMAYTFLKAQGKEVGLSLVDNEKIDYCKEMMAKAEKLGKKLLLPIDTTVAAGFPDPIDAPIDVEVVDSDKIPADKEGLDIGTKTQALFGEAVKSAKTVVWNGPMGVFENPTLAKGTIAVAKALADTDATTISGGGDSAAAAQTVLVWVMKGMLKLLHPFMPFITEEIWSAIDDGDVPVMLSDYPVFDEKLVFTAEEEAFEKIIDAIKAVRNRRSEMNVVPSVKAKLYIETADADIFKSGIIFFEKLASASSVEIGASFDVPDSVTAITHSARIFIPLDDLVDKEKELARLAKEKAAVQKDIDFSQGKLNNPGFMAKAPEKQVEAEKAKLAKALDKMAKIEQSIAAFSK